MGAKENSNSGICSKVVRADMGAIQPDVKFGSDTDDAVVLQGLTRQLSNNLLVGFLWTLLIVNGL